jgi:hypothetical protein
MSPQGPTRHVTKQIRRDFNPITRGIVDNSVTVYYYDGSTASASQIVTVSPGTLSNCLALTLTAGQNGSILLPSQHGFHHSTCGNFEDSPIGLAH